jgi:hypothetical protein
MIPVVERRQGTFFAETDRKELENRLELQENFLWDAIVALAGRAAPEAAATPPVRAITHANFTAPLDAICPIDTTIGNVVVSLPKASVDNAGHSIWIIRTTLTNTIMLQCAERSIIHGTIPVDIGLYRLMSDGVAWWREQ